MCVWVCICLDIFVRAENLHTTILVGTKCCFSVRVKVGFRLRIRIRHSFLMARVSVGS